MRDHGVSVNYDSVTESKLVLFAHDRPIIERVIN